MSDNFNLQDIITKTVDEVKSPFKCLSWERSDDGLGYDYRFVTHIPNGYVGDRDAECQYIKEFESYFDIVTAVRHPYVKDSIIQSETGKPITLSDLKSLGASDRDSIRGLIMQGKVFIRDYDFMYRDDVGALIFCVSVTDRLAPKSL